MRMRTECAKDLFPKKYQPCKLNNLQGFFCKISLHFTDIGLDITLYNGIM